MDDVSVQRDGAETEMPFARRVEGGIQGFRHQHPPQQETEGRFRFGVAADQVGCEPADARQMCQCLFVLPKLRAADRVEGQERGPACLLPFQEGDGLFGGVCRADDQVLGPGPEGCFHSRHIFRFHLDQCGSRSDDGIPPGAGPLHDGLDSFAKSVQGLLHVFQHMEPGFHAGGTAAAVVVAPLHSCQFLLLPLHFGSKALAVAEEGIPVLFETAFPAQQVPGGFLQFRRTGFLFADFLFQFIAAGHALFLFLAELVQIIT